jgi:hypothetical protein
MSRKHSIQPTVTEDTDEEANSHFRKELKLVYSEIDKQSNLCWNMKDTYELVTRADKARTTRSRVSTQVKEESRKLYENTNAQFGYGEITPVSKLKQVISYV